MLNLHPYSAADVDEDDDMDGMDLATLQRQAMAGVTGAKKSHKSKAQQQGLVGKAQHGIDLTPSGHFTN